MPPLKLLIADDHSIVLTGVQALIAREPDLVVVAEASNGRDLPDLVAVHQPDMLILDLNMPGPNPIQQIQALRQASPGLAIIALTMHDDPEWVRGVLMAGASGYVLKDEASVELVQAIRAVADGGSWVTPSLAAALAPADGGAGGPAHDLPLTPRETEVLILVAQGLSNQQISVRLHISPYTARNHLSNLYAKLGVNTRVKLVRIAMDRGLVGSSLERHD